jgi:hypothetical protein
MVQQILNNSLFVSTRLRLPFIPKFNTYANEAGLLIPLEGVNEKKAK